MESTRLVDCARYVCQRGGGGGEDFAVTGELGARFIPGETLPARPTQLFFPPPPSLFRERRGSMVPVFDAERLFILADFYSFLFFKRIYFSPSGRRFLRI